MSTTATKAPAKGAKTTTGSKSTGTSNYKCTCTLTGEVAGTNPKVFGDRAKRYSMSPDDLRKVYVGRFAQDLLRGLVHDKGMKPAEAVQQIRKTAGVADKFTTPIPQNVLDIILAKSTSEDKDAQKEQFEARKKSMMKDLLGRDYEPAKRDEGDEAPAAQSAAK